MTRNGIMESRPNLRVSLCFTDEELVPIAVQESGEFNNVGKSAVSQLSDLICPLEATLNKFPLVSSFSSSDAAVMFGLRQHSHLNFDADRD
jgi:hypothetical protein